MGRKDGFGADISCDDQAAIDAFHAAAVRNLGYQRDPEQMIQEVLKEHPDFIMARCFLAGLFLTASDKRYQAKLATELKRLEPLAHKANTRESGHIEAMALWLSGDLHAASQAYADILLEHPRDLCALQFGHQTDFLLGVATSTRDRPARVLRHWSEKDPEFSFVLGMLAFGLEESGHYLQAEETARRAVTLNPRDTWSIHAFAHCCEMQGKVETGISFMKGCQSNWTGNNYLAIHNRWHYELFHLEICDFSSALADHDRYMVINKDSALMDMHDSASMLWRLSLYGVECGNRWNVVADRYAEVIDQAYMSFTDMHAMMAFSATGRRKEAEALVGVLEANVDGSNTVSAITRAVGLPIVRGIKAFGEGDYQTAKALLGKVRHTSHMIGGSAAQRDVISLTLMEAAIRSRDAAMVEGLIAERSLMKPESPLIGMFRSRLTS